MDDNKSASKLNSNYQSEFSGHISNIIIAGAGFRYQFDLVNNKKVRNSYILSISNLTGFTAMAALITSAYMVGKKIHVRGEANSEGLPIVVHVRIGAKSKVQRDKKLKLTVRVKGPAVEAHQAAQLPPN